MVSEDAVVPDEDLCCYSKWGVLFFRPYFIKLGVKREVLKKIKVIVFLGMLFFIFSPILSFQMISPFKKWLFIKVEQDFVSNHYSVKEGSQFFKWEVT